MSMADELSNDEATVRITPLGAPKAKRPGGLGRGLSALLGDIQADVPLNAPASQRNGVLSKLDGALSKPHGALSKLHGALSKLHGEAWSLSWQGRHLGEVFWREWMAGAKAIVEG